MLAFLFSAKIMTTQALYNRSAQNVTDYPFLEASSVASREVPKKSQRLCITSF
jgi:hypothetical protein